MAFLGARSALIHLPFGGMEKAAGVASSETGQWPSAHAA
jgi:hypothetical protein